MKNYDFLYIFFYFIFKKEHKFSSVKLIISTYFSLFIFFSISFCLSRELNWIFFYFFNSENWRDHGRFSHPVKKWNKYVKKSTFIKKKLKDKIIFKNITTITPRRVFLLMFLEGYLLCNYFRSVWKRCPLCVVQFAVWVCFGNCRLNDSCYVFKFNFCKIWKNRK